MNGDLTYNDFLQRLRIQDVLVDAGYHLNKRDGLRYPSYVRTDRDGRRVHGDKFLVTPNGQCCFQPPRQKLYNVISFIKFWTADQCHFIFDKFLMKISISISCTICRDQ